MIQRPVFLEDLHGTRDIRALLADRDVDAGDVPALLVDNGVDRNGGLSGLTVADDQLTLSAADRGKRMVEILKQDQYVPMSAEEQIMIIFAGTQGSIDDVPVEAIKKFEEEFLRYMRDRKADVVKELAQKKAIDDDMKAKLTAAIEEFKKGFQA